jgi:hypothetical protein
VFEKLIDQHPRMLTSLAVQSCAGKTQELIEDHFFKLIEVTNRIVKEQILVCHPPTDSRSVANKKSQLT